MLVCGLVVPVHLLAVDVNVIQEAGKQTPGLIRNALDLADEQNLGAAQMLWRAAQIERVPGREPLGLAVTNLAALRPSWMLLGSPDAHLERLLASAAEAGPNSKPSRDVQASEPFTDLLVPAAVRERALGLMEASAGTASLPGPD
jgi:hypothetical protein